MPSEDSPAGLLAAIVASSDDAIVSKDLNGYVTSWNRGAERVFGYASEEMIGQHITRIIPVDRLAEEDFVLSRVRSGDVVDHFETIRQRKDGTLINISLTVSPVRGERGRIVGASKIARDITEQKRLQHAADEASRAKDEFLATLSHELRTPLNTVLGYTHMLQQGTIPTADLPRALEAIGRNAEALTRLVNDVLDTSRIVTGRIRLSLQRCDLSSIAEEAVAGIAPAATAKSIRVRSHIAPDLVLQADPDRLRQVLWNLLTNAVKFTPEGGAIAFDAVGEPGGIRISLQDTGIGIAPESMPHIFRRFWQADASHTRIQGGLGLGLALARDFVELHGGTIAATSDGLGRGARFDVQLPIAQASVVGAEA